MSDKTRLFPHYFKATEHLDEVDVYQVLKLFDPQDPSTALGHAVKKILLPGSRGSKGRKQDIEEAIASLQRYLDINYGDSSRASHETVTSVIDDGDTITVNISSRKGEESPRPSNDPDKGLTLKELLDAPVMQLPDGVQGVEPTTPTEELITKLKLMAVADFEKSYSAAVEQHHYKMDELNRYSRRQLELIDRMAGKKSRIRA